MNTAKECEKEYNWQDAAECYKQAIILLTEPNRMQEAARICDRVGFCYVRAAFQAQAYSEFKERMKKSALAYEEESKLLEAADKEEEAELKHARAFSAYARSYLENTAQKRKKLLAEWWTLENEALATYEAAGDHLAVGKTISSMLEHSNHNRYWLTSNVTERRMVLEEGFALVEKAIQALSKLDDTLELARIYCFASWFYSWGDFQWESEEETLRQNRICQDFANKAVELSHKIDDAWLKSWAQLVAWNAASLYDRNPIKSLAFAEKTFEYGRMAKDRWLMGFAQSFIAWATIEIARMQEDPDKQKALLEKTAKFAQEGVTSFKNINHTRGTCLAYNLLTNALNYLASIETDPKRKHEFIERISSLTQEIKTQIKVETILFEHFFGTLSRNLNFLSQTKSEIEEKRQLLQEALIYANKSRSFNEKIAPISLGNANTLRQLFSVQNELSKVATHREEEIEFLTQAVISIEKSIEIFERKKKLYVQTGSYSSFLFGQAFELLGGALQQLYSLTKEKDQLYRAIEAYKKAVLGFKNAEIPTNIAESYWHCAKILDQLGKRELASENYDLAAEAYEQASAKIPQLAKFYSDYSGYMRAWSQISQAKYAHSIEDYDKARQNYRKAAGLHELLEPWSYLAPNYLAWAEMEEAENQSRKENTQQAKQTFQKALEQFNIAEKSFKQKIENIKSGEEEELINRLLQASDLRRKFCQARIRIEEARLLDREGKYLQSSQSYEEAAQNILAIVERVEAETERKELELLMTLCQAWKKMAIAQETASSESYLDAANLFEQAKKHCYTQKASLWTLGNISFCKGLAAGTRYQESMDQKENALAKSYLKSAATSYLQAGFKSASEYAKATQRLFDAYIFMNQAENEINPESRAKQYQMAENLLEIAAGSFMRAKQPEKTVQVQGILATVREEKALAISLNEVLHAPTITSSTFSFAAPSPTSEVSVGLEQLQHANLQANLLVGMTEVKVGESFCLSVEFVNAGREPALLIRVEDFVPPDFIVVKKPEIYRIEDTCLNMKGKQITPLKLVEAKLVLQPSRKGVYNLSPTVHYLDEVGQNKSLQLKSVEIKVEEIILSDRISTGTKELDSLLLGGIPEGYALVLSGPPSDERDYLIKNFLEAGVKKEQICFYVATEADGLENLLEKSGFYLFLCNPKPKVEVPDLPKITKLGSKTDINNLNMALARTSRNAVQSKGVKRVCIEIVSDVLLRQGPEVTRRWLSELITDLGSKGFTFIAVMNPGMHPPDQATAVIDLFDGEITVTQSDDPQECKKSVQVKKLRGQEYIKNPICITIKT